MLTQRIMKSQISGKFRKQVSRGTSKKNVTDKISKADDWALQEFGTSVNIFSQTQATSKPS